MLGDRLCLELPHSGRLTPVEAYFSFWDTPSTGAAAKGGLGDTEGFGAIPTLGVVIGNGEKSP